MRASGAAARIRAKASARRVGHLAVDAGADGVGPARGRERVHARRRPGGDGSRRIPREAPADEGGEAEVVAPEAHEDHVGAVGEGVQLRGHRLPASLARAHEVGRAGAVAGRVGEIRADRGRGDPDGGGDGAPAHPRVAGQRLGGSRARGVGVAEGDHPQRCRRRRGRRFHGIRRGAAAHEEEDGGRRGEEGGSADPRTETETGGTGRHRLDPTRVRQADRPGQSSTPR